MSDTSLRYLHAAAAHGSMRAAGDSLNVAVSSISRQIAQLEAELGVRLLETGRRTIKLTRAGQLVVEFYEARLAQHRTFLERLATLRDARSGSVRLALGEGVPTLALHRALDGFRARHPGVELTLLTPPAGELVSLVIEDEAHAALGLALPSEPKLRVRATSSQPFAVIVHPDHPLAQSDGVTFEELARHELCLAPRSSRLRQLLAPAELRQGAWLNAGVTTDSTEAMRELARLGRVATVLPQITVQTDLEAGLLVARPLLGVDPDAPRLELVTRLGRQLPEAATSVLHVLDQQMSAWSHCGSSRPASLRAGSTAGS